MDEATFRKHYAAAKRAGTAPVGAEHPPRQAMPPAAGTEMMREIIGGPIDALGAPVDAVNSALQYVGAGSDRPIGGSERMREAVGLPRPTTPGGKAVNVMAGGLPFSAGIVARAPKLAQRGTPLANPPGRPVAPAGAPLPVTPGAPLSSGARGPVIASEISGNLGAGAGMLAGASMSDNPLIQAALGLAGGTVAPGPVAGNAASRTLHEGRPNVRANRRIRAAVGDNPGMAQGDVLADSSESARRELDRTYARLGSGDETVDEVGEFLRDRSTMSGEELLDSLGENTYQPSIEAIKAQKQRAAPDYRRAYQTEINMTPELQRLFALPAVKREWTSPGLVRAAENAASAEGLPLGKIGGEPSVQGLDYLIRRFDSMINAIKRNPSPTDSLGDLVSIRQQLRAAVADASPDLDRARSTFAGPARAQEMIEQGETFLRGNANKTARELAELNPGERSLYKIGALEALEQRIGQLGDTHDVTKIFRNENARKRMRALLSEDEYETFQDTVERLANQQRTYSSVTGGSQTAQRLGGGPIDNEILGVVLDVIPKGQQAGRAFRVAGKHFPGSANVDDIVARAMISRQVPNAIDPPARTRYPAGFGFMPGILPDDVYDAFSDADETRR